MRLSFLLPRVERLDGSGTITLLHEGGVLGRLRPTVLLLARDRCAFALFETANLPANRRRQAARLHARVASPYLAGGASLVRAGNDFGVWWWDLERLAADLASRGARTRPLVRPETLAQPIGRGWRIVALTQGYEAQYWQAGALRASAWRPTRFDAASWGAFSRLVRGDTPPSDLPAPVQLPLAPDSEAFSIARTEISRNQALGLVAGSLALIVACGTLFLMGQGLALRAEAREIAAETAEIRLATPRLDATRGLEQDRQRLTAYRQAEEQTNPVSAVGAAVGIAAIYDLSPDAVAVSEGVMTLTLPLQAARQIDDLVAEFEGSGYFFDVRPRTDPSAQTLVIEMQVREAAPPLTAGG